MMEESQVYGMIRRSFCKSKAEINKAKGAVTVETAMVLPLFICVIVSIIFLMRVVHLHEKVQHAIDRAAEEMATLGYLYHVSGLQELHDTVDTAIEKKAAAFDERLSVIFDSFQIPETLASGMPDEATGNSADEMKNIAGTISELAFEQIKTEMCIPLMKFLIGKYLDPGTVSADTYLRGLHVVGGMDGLDFHRSRIFEDEQGNIDIVVSYTVDLPLPVKLLPPIRVTQRTVVRAWLGGDEAPATPEEENIWAIANHLERGTRLEEIFNTNLPKDFPTLDSFYPETGKAIMLCSMDLTAASYQTAAGVIRQVDKYIEKLKNYIGTEKPWGSQQIEINEKDIRSKELILVIPKNPVASEIEEALKTCVEHASASGLTLTVRKYGLKTSEEEEEP